MPNVIVLDGDNSKGKEIGKIDSWGPLFRISLDLIIHSRVSNGFSSVLAFKGNGGRSDCCEIGDRIPAIFLYNPTMTLNFANSVRQNGNYWFDFKINLNTWYNIIIEQKFVHRKVKRKYERFNFSTFPAKQKSYVCVILRLTIL